MEHVVIYYRYRMRCFLCFGRFFCSCACACVSICICVCVCLCVNTVCVFQCVCLMGWRREQDGNHIYDV